MHILHWYPNFLAGGGVAQAVTGLATAQAAHGERVSVATRLAHAPAPAKQPFELLTWTSHDLFRLGDRLPRLISPADARRLNACTPDIVHIHGAFLPDNLHALRLFRASFILSAHGSLHPLVFARGNKLLKKLYFLLEKRLLYRRVHALHALTPLEAEALERLFPGTPLACIPHGIDPTPWLAPSAPLPERPITFTFVGRLDIFTKGLDVLIEAFAKAVRALPDQPLRLQLIGPEQGQSRALLEEMAAAWGVGPLVEFAGAVPTSRIPSYLHQASVYVQLSRREGFPLTVAEALLANRPVIVSEGTGLATCPEIAALPHVRIASSSALSAAEAMIDFARRLPHLHHEARRHEASIQDFFSAERAVTQYRALYRSALRGLPKGSMSARRTPEDYSDRASGNPARDTFTHYDPPVTK